MLRTLQRRIAVFASVGMLAATVAYADSWNERTIITFSEPVLIPGATLEPGTYVFKLLDSNSTRHTVQVLREDGDGVVALTQAVPLKRMDSKGDIVLRFDPTEAGTPPAIRAWFYPGSIYGHQFIYPDAQARQIADRTKTVVLSIDHAGTDLESGRLMTYDATGNRGEWKADDEVMKEWDSWQREREMSRDRQNRDDAAQSRSETAKQQQAPVAPAGSQPARDAQQQAGTERTDAANRQQADRQPADAGRVVDTSPQERRQATALAVSDEFTGQRIALDDLEDEPMKFVGKTVSVDGEVEKVFGPRLFTIDESNWIDFDGETLVHVPTALAALVREGDSLTITGEVKRFATADVEKEWGWIGVDPDTTEEYEGRPLLVASRIVGGDNNMVLLIDVDEKSAKTAGQRQEGQTAQSPAASRDASRDQDQTRSAGEPAITNAAEIGAGGDDLIGRRVTLRDVKVDEMTAHGGFYMTTDGDSVFVLPSNGSQVNVSGGDTVTIEGIVLRAPRNMALEGDLPQDTNAEIYVLATDVKR